MSEREDDDRRESKKREKDKEKGQRYKAFHSDASDESDGELEETRPKGKKVKREKSRTLALPRIKPKKHQKKKEKDKEKKKKKPEALSPPPRKPIFRIPLAQAVKQSILPDGVELPRVLREGIMFVERTGLSIEGIYRVSGAKSKVDALKDLYDQGKQVDLNEYEPEVVASLIKQYLRELPENALTMLLAPRFHELVGMQDKKEQLEKTKQLIAELPSVNRTLLAWTITHMSHVIGKASENKMSLQNISIVLNPTMSISHGVLFILFTHVEELFPDTKMTMYDGPLTFRLDEDEADLPSSPDAIASALAKQEAILANLHKELNISQDDHTEGQDELLWEIQRKVTQLKRKLRVARRSSESKLAEEQKKKSKQPENDEDDELIKLLEASEAELLIEQEELTAIGTDLRKQILNERSEIERLREEIALVLEQKDSDQVLSDKGRGSASSGSDTEVDEAELDHIFKEMVKQNEELERKNTKLCHEIHDQREACAELKVQIRITEQRKCGMEQNTEQEKPEANRRVEPSS